MKRIMPAIILVILNVSQAISQVNENRPFLYLYSDSVVYGDDIEYKTPIVGPHYFIVDSRRIEQQFVKFYSDGGRILANTKTLNISGNSNFTGMIRKGKINLYETEIRTYNRGVMTRKINNYYNKGYGDLKKANYQNLRVDLSDNPVSLMHLNTYKETRDKETVLYVLGGVAIVAGFAALISKVSQTDEFGTQEEPNITGSIITIGLGTGFSWGGYLIGLKKPKYLKKAIDVYNE